MVLINKRKMNVIMVVIGLLLFVYAFYLKYRASLNKPDHSFAYEVINHGAVVEQVQPVGTANISAQAKEGDKVDPKKFVPSITFTEYRELRDWDAARGYFSADELEDYEAYNEQTLKNLAAEGDIKAMNVLSSYYMQKDYRPEEARALDYKAAVYGATSVFADLANNAHADMQRNEIIDETYKNPERRKEGVIEVLAYYKVAAMRGDPRASIPHMSSYKKLHKIRTGEELALSPEMLDKIDSRAKEIYDELVRARRELGLGEFDNSTPETVKKDYEGKTSGLN